MMDFWSITWGDVGTVIGIVVSVVGLGWAIKVAGGARTASEEAERATLETRDQVARRLQGVDLQRAIGLIGRIKTLHDNERWEGSTELYQTLREMLSDIIVRCPAEQTDIRGNLTTARTIVRDIENLVRPRVGRGIPEREQARLNRSLNDIQSDLEELASNLGFGDSQGVTE